MKRSQFYLQDHGSDIINFLPPSDGSDSTRAMNPKSIGHRKIKLDPMAKL